MKYRAELGRHGIRNSMSGKGNSYGKVLVETMFKRTDSALVSCTVACLRYRPAHAITCYIAGVHNAACRKAERDDIITVRFGQDELR